MTFSLLVCTSHIYTQMTKFDIRDFFLLLHCRFALDASAAAHKKHVLRPVFNVMRNQRHPNADLHEPASLLKQFKRQLHNFQPGKKRKTIKSIPEQNFLCEKRKTFIE